MAGLPGRYWDGSQTQKNVRENQVEQEEVASGAKPEGILSSEERPQGSPPPLLLVTSERQQHSSVAEQSEQKQQRIGSSNGQSYGGVAKGNFALKFFFGKMDGPRQVINALGNDCVQNVDTVRVLCPLNVVKEHSHHFIR